MGLYNTAMLSDAQRRQFDRLLEDIIAGLPDHIRRLLEEVPVIVEDEPDPGLIEDMGMTDEEFMLCGLHWGVALTERSVESPPELPDQIMLFRGPIMRLAAVSSTGTQRRDRKELEGQIRITLLHEIGHHFGLNEDDLEQLGYA